MTFGQWLAVLEDRLSSGEELAALALVVAVYLLLVVPAVVGVVRWLGRRQWPVCVGCGRRVPPDAGLHLCGLGGRR